MLPKDEIVTTNNKESSEPTQRTTEDAFTKATGALQKWQLWICFLLFLSKFPVAFNQLGIIFLAPPVAFTCAKNDTSEIFDNVCVKGCTQYNYDTSVFTSTIVSEWDLICEKHWLNSFSQTMVMFGILLGNMVFGHLSDRYGRRLPFIGGSALQLVAGVAAAFAPSYILFTLLRFLAAVATGGTMITSFVLVMEIIGAKYRDCVGILYQIPFNMGHLTLPLIAYFIRDWRTYQLVLSLPSLWFLTYLILLPESPRWLIAMDRKEEAATVMTKAAKCNGLPTEQIPDVAQSMVEEVRNRGRQHKASFVELFKTPKIRARTLAICFNWFVCGLCFYGVTQYIGQFSGNIFLNVAMSAAIQIPATILAIFVNKYLGRKFTLISSSLLVGLSCILIIAFPKHGMGQVALGCIGVFGGMVAFCTVYLYSGELFPTVLRNSGVGLSSMAARVGSMIAPFVATLTTTSEYLPPLIFGVIAILGAALCIILPETSGKKLPDTLEEVENIR